MNKVVLLLGSNLDNKEKNIKTALNIINQDIGEISKQGDILKSLPEGYVSNNYYLNIGIIILTRLSPISLLNAIKKIEKNMGRIKDSSDTLSYEDRVIDIDIVYFNSINFYSKKLTIPHVLHIEKRDFSKKILGNLI